MTAAARPGSAPPARRALAAALAVAALALASTAEERTFGLFSDGKIMTRTSFAIAGLGELGIARGYRVEVRRPEGDAVTRYGVGAALAFSLPMLAAGVLERHAGPGASQTLFVAEQIAFVLAAALLAGLLVTLWGGAPRDASRALLACALASPLAAYACSDYSEPLQACLVAGAFVLASAAALRGRPGLAFAAGACASLALLTKSLLLILLPPVLALLFFAGERSGRIRRLLAASAGFAAGAAAWLAFELARFGRPFGGYQGERFSNPPLDGLWRLTIGPNKGLLLYFPLAALALPGALVLARKSRAAALATGGFCVALLAAISAWWAWDGTGGWGPRLLMPAVPLVAALAALGAARAPRGVFAALLAAGILVNALGVFTPDAFVTWFYALLPPRPISGAEAARFPAFAVERDAKGGARLYRIHAAALDPALSPLRISAWLLKTRLAARDPLRAVSRGPWNGGARPGEEVAAPETVVPRDVLRLLAAPARWPHLGMCLSGRGDPDEGAFAYLDGLQNQVFRAQDNGRFERAVVLAERLYELSPGPRSAAVLLESYRLAGRKETIASWLETLPAARTTSLDFGLSLALYARDIGDARRARELAEEVARASSLPLAARLSRIPTSAWPARLRDLNASARAD